MSDERWLPVSGYDGAYDVSNLGRVRTWRYPGRNKKDGASGTALAKAYGVSIATISRIKSGKRYAR